MTSQSADIASFWESARQEFPHLPEDPPQSWPFGATAEHADELLGLVLEGVKTGTSSPLWDYQETGEAIPTVGELNIILDGTGQPRAIIEITAVDVVPFHHVTAQHAHAEGEGERTTSHWREVHERFWRHYSENPRGYEPDMPVVCERFRLLYAA